MKRKRIKEIDLFLPNEEIEKLNERYAFLYKRVKSSPDLSEDQIAAENEILRKKYDFEIKEISAQYEAAYKQRQAKIEAQNTEQIPWRRCWLWHLLFQPVTNRAQDIIEKQAKLDAEELFAPKEKELKTRSEKLYGKKRHWWQRLFHKKRRTEPGTAEPKTPSKPSNVAHGESDAAPMGDDVARKAAQKQLEEAIKQADETPCAEAFEQPEPPEPPTRKSRNTKPTGDKTP